MHKSVFIIIATAMTCMTACGGKRTSDPELATVYELIAEAAAGHVAGDTSVAVVDQEELCIDTVMAANGHAFGYRGDISDWGGWYYDTTRVGDDMMLRYEAIRPGTLKLDLVTRDLTVKIGQSGAMERIKKFLGPIEGFGRVERTRKECFDSVVAADGSKIEFWGAVAFVADFALPRQENAAMINEFASYLAGLPNDMSGNIPAAGERFIRSTLKGWKRADHDYPSGYRVKDLAIRAHVAGAGFVTFSKYQYNYDGGMHGNYTQTFHTLDLISGRRLSNSEIFEPGTEESVRDQLFWAMANDPLLRKINLGMDDASKVKAYITKWKDEPFSLPEGALVQDGVVFSFQPYEIGSWADGAYHIIVSYHSLAPYLTPQVKSII